MRKHEIKILKLCILIATLVLFALIFLGAYIHYRKYHFINRGKVIKVVGGHKVYEKDIESKLKFFGDGTKFDDLDNDIKTAILLEDYIREKIFKLAKQERKLNELKFLRDEYYKQLVINYYIEDKLFKNITEKDVQNRYYELVERIKEKEEREIYHILLPTEEEARRTLNLILRSGNFENVAKRRSLDKISALNGGNIGYVIKEELDDPEFADVVFLLKEGEISKPIETKDGWHIIKVGNIRTVKPKTYEESKDDILKYLKQEKYDEFIETFQPEKVGKNIVFDDPKKEPNDSFEQPSQDENAATDFTEESSDNATTTEESSEDETITKDVATEDIADE
jgi:parvulin-like peptidyl-prolyl isomerase